MTLPSAALLRLSTKDLQCDYWKLYGTDDRARAVNVESRLTRVWCLLVQSEDQTSACLRVHTKWYIFSIMTPYYGMWTFLQTIFPEAVFVLWSSDTDTSLQYLTFYNDFVGLLVGDFATVVSSRWCAAEIGLIWRINYMVCWCLWTCCLVFKNYSINLSDF
jgi:hypothetical protein